MALVAVAAAGVAAWQVFELRSTVIEIRTEIAERLAASDASLVEVRALSRQQQETIAGLQGKIGALDAHVAATEGQAAALESLYQEFSRTREDRVVAEAEQAVNIAAQQLQLAGNFEAALIALQGAEARLAGHDRGQLQPLRRALVRDIERLKATPQVDVPGIALRLEALLARVDTLPLAFAGQLDKTGPTATEDSAGSTSTGRPVIDYLAALGRDLWHEIRTLVRVERLDRSDPVLLAPAQGTYLRENLKIRLLTARLALLARDGRTYAADLAQAREWVERFFDLRDPAVQEVLAELAALESLPVKVEPPSPTESFAALRLLQARNSGARAPAADGGGEPLQSGPSPAAPPKDAVAPGGAGQRAAPPAPAAAGSGGGRASGQVPAAGEAPRDATPAGGTQQPTTVPPPAAQPSGAQAR